MFNFIRNLFKRWLCKNHSVITYKQFGYCVVKYCRNCEYLECIDAHKGKCKPPAMLDHEREMTNLETGWRELGFIFCPDCATKMLQGPSGGLSVNYACPDCHSRFNIGYCGERLYQFERTGKVDEQTLDHLFDQQST